MAVNKKARHTSCSAICDWRCLWHGISSGYYFNFHFDMIFTFVIKYFWELGSFEALHTIIGLYGYRSPWEFRPFFHMYLFH